MINLDRRLTAEILFIERQKKNLIEAGLHKSHEKGFERFERLEQLLKDLQLERRSNGLYMTSLEQRLDRADPKWRDTTIEHK